MNDESYTRLSKEQKEEIKSKEGFHPGISDREMRKLVRKLYFEAKRQGPPVYTETGLHIASGKDWCDCFDEECPGCFFPCRKCDSPKCGKKCRNNRTYSYTSYQIEGLDSKVMNKAKEYERAAGTPE